MITPLKLKDVFPNYDVGHALFYYFVSPVWREDFDKEELDQFFFRFYGERNISPFIEKFLNTNNVIDHDTARVICALIYNIYGNSWEHLYEDMIVEYNPIENTDVYETTSDSKSGSGTNGNTRTLNTSTADTGTNGNTRTLNTTTGQTTSASVDSTATGSGSDAENVFGFDSATAVGKSSGSTSNSTTTDTDSSGSTTTTDTGTITDAGTLTNTQTNTGTVTDSGTNSMSETFSRTYRKHGNIGIQTPADMLTADVEFWKWSYIMQVFEDILHVISLSVY